MAEYFLLSPEEHQWCRVHRRTATCIRYAAAGQPPVACCDPKLGGIMVPCDCVPLERKEGEPRLTLQELVSKRRCVACGDIAPTTQLYELRLNMFILRGICRGCYDHFKA